MFFYDPRVRQHLQQTGGELHERRELWIEASTLEEHKEDTHWRLVSPEQLLAKKSQDVVTTGLVLGRSRSIQNHISPLIEGQKKPFSIDG